MANNFRKTQRRQEIADLIEQGRAAHAAGKSRHAAPWKPFESTNLGHWLKGWDAAEDERVQAEREAARLEAMDNDLDYPGSGRIAVCGKQILLDGVHLADARDPAAAAALGAALEFSGIAFTSIPSDAATAILELLS